MEEGGVERKREEIRRKLEEKRREMLEREGEVVAERQQGQDESHIRKILKIEPYGPFKKGEKKPVPIEISEIGLKGDINEVKLSDALKEAEKMKKDGLSGDTIVSLRLPEKHGGLGREKQTTLKKLLQPKTREKLRKDFAGGGVIILGGEEKVSETSSALGLKSEQAASTLLKLAGIIAEKSEEEPGKMRGEYAKSVASILDAVKSLIMGSGEESTTAGFLGGDAEGRKPLRAFKGPTWYQLDETSKLAAVWWMENVKFRGQYAYAGTWLGHQWEPIKAWKKLEKARRKRKKYTKLEKLLDIFYINIEDVFQVDTLTAEEIFDLEDYRKKHPTERQYQALLKLMKEEGYVEERQFISAVQVAKKFQPSDVYYGR